MDTNPQKLVWALTDGRPGNDNQVIAVAEKLGNYEIKHISFNKLAELPNCLLGTSTLGINTRLSPPYPDIVISAGRKLSRVARIIKKRSGCAAFQLMWPGYGNKSFDLIFAPKHDQLPPHSNVVETYGPPNRLTPHLLAIEAEKWKQHIPIDEKSVFAVLIGDVSIAEAQKLARIVDYTSGYPLITTSRRTRPEAVAEFKKNINKERYIYEWKPEGENPYLGIIGLADFIIATNDSISMSAEAVSTGKPVYIFETNVPEKHKLFTNSLFSSGLAKPLTDLKPKPYKYQPLNTLDLIISKIAEKVEN